VNKIILVFLMLLCFTCAVLSQDSKEDVTYEDELSNIVNEFNALKEELTEARSEYRKLKEDYISKTKECAAKLAQIQDCEPQLNELQNAKSSLEAQLKSLKEQIGQLTISIQEKDKTIAELTQNKQVLSSGIQEKDKIIVSLEQTQRDLDAQLKSLQEKTAQLTVSSQDKDKTIAGLEQGQQESLKKQFELTAKVKGYEDELTRLKMAQDTQAEVLKTKEDSLRSQNEQLTNSVKDKDKIVADLTEKFQQFPNQVKEYEGKVASLQNEKLTLQNQLNDYKTKELEWQKNQQELAGEINNKDKSIQDLKASVKEYPSKLDEMKKLNAEIQERNKVLFNDNKLFKKKIDGYSRKLYQVAVLKERLLKENAILHYNLGVFYLQQQQYNEAIREFEKDLEFNPDDAAAHYNLGLIYAEYLDNKPKAIKHFKRYITLDPKDKDVDRAKKYVMTWEMWQDDNVEPHPEFIDK
jgi:chromosome segregation ATPase